jgi:hypothetical protein
VLTFKPMSSFTTETAKRARCRKAGLHAARVNRATGWQNLVRARAVRSDNAALRRRALLLDRARAGHVLLSTSPWGPRGAWMCACGEFGVGDSLAQLHVRGAIWAAPPDG